MTKIFSVFPGMGKTTIFKNMTEAGVTVADSDSSQFSWDVVDGQKVRSKEFPANYMKHIKGLIGKVDYIFVSTHKEVIAALLAEGIDFKVVRPSVEHKEVYIRRYQHRRSPKAFVELMNANWTSFINDIDNSGAEVIVAEKLGSYLSDVLNLEFKLKKGTPGVYLVNKNSTEVRELIRSYLCYRNIEGVPPIRYVGDIKSLEQVSNIKEEFEDNDGYILVSNTVEAVKFMNENNINAKILEYSLEHDSHNRSKLHFGGMPISGYELPTYRIVSLIEFLDIDFPKVSNYNIIIDRHNGIQLPKDKVLSPTILVDDVSSAKSIINLAREATRIIYVLDPSNIDEQDHITIGILSEASSPTQFRYAVTQSKSLSEVKDVVALCNKFENYLGDDLFIRNSDIVKFLNG